MTGYLLDTNVPSELIHSKADERVLSRMRSHEDESLYLSAITIGEFRKGINTLPEGKRKAYIQEWLEKDVIPMFAGRILPVTQSIAEHWGVLSAKRQLFGRPLSMADGLIAATAKRHNLTLVTRNGKDFEGLEVEIIDPWT